MFEPAINHTTEEEHNRVMEEMASFNGLYFQPSVGIFWLNPQKEELFGVYSVPIETLNPQYDTVVMLHQDLWAKNCLRAKKKGLKDSIYLTDYTQIPRGRIFYNRKTGQFSVKVGHWISQYESVLTPLIQEEFNLKEFAYDIDEHWDLGHGWSEHNFNVDAK